jgi:hypothetical protein
MRILPGKPEHISNQSISSMDLVKHAVVNPDILPTVFELFSQDYTFLSSILNQKGMKTKGLYQGVQNANYRHVKSNVIQYAIRHTDRVKIRFAKNADGQTFICDAYPTQPGRNQSIIYVYLDSNWVGPKEVIELNDNRTQIYVIDDQAPIEEAGAWRYMCKVVTRDPDEFVNPVLMQEGAEAMDAYTMYEHDFSETGNEKYTFDGWGTVHMTLQRIKYSYSGTAAAMTADKVWTIHNGQTTWISKANVEMLQRAAMYDAHQKVFGKGTVNEDGKVIMTDKQGREIMSGDGIMNQGDGAYEYPYNSMTIKMIDSVLQDVDIRSGKDGVMEVAVIGGRKAVNAFNQSMRDAGFITQNNNVVGDGDNKVVNNNYAGYIHSGVKLTPSVVKAFDERPSKPLSDGTPRASWDMIFVPLGVTSGGDNQVELVQLRPAKTGSVHGIDKGGDNMSNSVDGSHHHFLWQSGIISRAKIAMMYRNYNS